MITRAVHTKTRYIGIRLSPAEQEKVIALSLLTPAPGNVSEAIRMLIAQAPEVKAENTGGKHPEPEGAPC
jgi:hypothetical protein